MTTNDETSEATLQLQADIATTRQRVASEVDAIADKFTADSLKRKASSAAEHLASQTWQRARQHPVPLALLGAGLLLLVWRNRRRHRAQRSLLGVLSRIA